MQENNSLKLPTDVSLTLVLKKWTFKNRLKLTTRCLKLRVYVGIQTIVYIIKSVLFHWAKANTAPLGLEAWTRPNPKNNPENNLPEDSHSLP
jgi:hypothetical protein